MGLVLLTAGQASERAVHTISPERAALQTECDFLRKWDCDPQHNSCKQKGSVLEEKAARKAGRGAGSCPLDEFLKIVIIPNGINMLLEPAPAVL